MKVEDYRKLEADAMKMLGITIRSTKAAPEHRINAAKVALDHVQSAYAYGELDDNMYVEKEGEGNEPD